MNLPNLHSLTDRDRELVAMMASEFPSLWQAAYDTAHQNVNVALSILVRMVKRHVEVAADERVRRLIEQ